MISSTVRAIRIAAIPQWLSASPTSGRLYAGESASVNVQLDASGLEGALYPGEVHILTNDPVNPDIVVDVTLDVEGAPDAVVSPTSLAFGDGYLFIKGRAKRFAKIGGEMVSLAAVEALAARVWPGFGHVVVNLPDKKKGEQLVLLTENQKASRDELSAFAKSQGVTALSVPATIVHIDKLPLLGTGKTDFGAAKEIAEEKIR